MVARVITSTVDLLAFKSQWVDLLSRSANQSVHLTFDWFISGWEAFHRNDQLYVLTIIDVQQRCIGIAPLVITSGVYRGVKVKKIGFLSNAQNPSNDFILTKEREDECLRKIIDCLNSFQTWDLVDLRKMEVDTATGRMLKSHLARRREGFGVKDNTESPYVPTIGDWQVFWQSKSKRFRKSMRNKMNRAQKAGVLVVDKVSIQNSHAPELAEMLEISSKSWKKHIAADLLNKRQDWEFYLQLCDRLGESGALNLWLLRKQNKAIAFEFHLNCNGVAYPIRADYDENYKDISPGSILEHDIIKALFEEDEIHEYNTCGHTYNYLLNWTDLTRRHENIELFSKSVKMSSLYWMEYKLLPCMRKLKANKLRHLAKDWTVK